MRGYYAGFVTRYLAFLLDVALVAVVSFLFITVLRVTLNFFGFGDLLPETPRVVENAILSPRGMTLLRWLLTIIGSFLGFGVYSILAWVLVGKTVGKAVMGLRVLSTDGRRLKVRQAIIRALGYYVSGLALFLGFLWVLVDDRRQTWHDKLAGSFVVYEWDARYEERFVTAVNDWRESRRQRQAAREREQRVALEGDVVESNNE
jgi:uncharacterized RDD family membrane protein YckC